MISEVLVQGRGHPFVDGDDLDHAAPLVFTIADVLSASECRAAIDQIEALGPVDAPITTSAGFVMRPDIRNNQRVVFDDAALAAQLFERVRTAIPSRLCAMPPSGTNERFRCYRYTPGQRFAPHYDGAYRRNTQEISLLTLIVYLNADFTGGRTAFLHYDVEAVPRTGTALVFQHPLLHEGCIVKAGVKYAMRTDVMYRTEV